MSKRNVYDLEPERCQTQLRVSGLHCHNSVFYPSCPPPSFFKLFSFFSLHLAESTSNVLHHHERMWTLEGQSDASEYDGTALKYVLPQGCGGGGGGGCLLCWGLFELSWWLVWASLGVKPWKSALHFNKQGWILVSFWCINSTNIPWESFFRSV